MKRIIASIILALTMTTGLAAADAVSSQCSANVNSASIGRGTKKTLNVNNTNVTVGSGAYVIVNGNDNCVLAQAGGDKLVITGNNNYATSTRSSITFYGSGNLFDTFGYGGNSVKCNFGATANLVSTDYGKNCN